MAARYYQSKKDRRDERMGMERSSKVGDRKDSFNDEWRSDSNSYGMNPEYGFGANYFPTMSGEGRDSIQKPEMIVEDRRAIANLPQEVMIKAYPMTGPYLPEDLDDTGRGVDRQKNFDDSQRARGFYPKKV